MVSKHGETIVGLALHFLPKQGHFEGNGRDPDIRYEVVGAFINDADEHCDEWNQPNGALKDRPRLENAFILAAERQNVSLERAKQTCRIAYDAVDSKTKLEQFLEDLLRIESCYHEREY